MANHSCHKCKKTVNDDWACCPYCKAGINGPNAVITIRLSKTLHSELKWAAMEDSTSLNLYCVAALRDHITQRLAQRNANDENFIRFGRAASGSDRPPS